MIWTFLLSPLGRKIAIGVGLVLAAGIALRIYGNRVADKWYQKGRTEGITQIIQAKQAEWKIKEEELANGRKQLQQAALELEEQRKQTEANRTKIRGDLTRGIQAIRSDFAKASGNVEAIPASELDRYIRQALIELRDK